MEFGNLVAELSELKGIHGDEKCVGKEKFMAFEGRVQQLRDFKSQHGECVDQASYNINTSDA
jgi:hypothetical protein